MLTRIHFTLMPPVSFITYPMTRLLPQIFPTRTAFTRNTEYSIKIELSGQNPQRIYRQHTPQPNVNTGYNHASSWCNLLLHALIFIVKDISSSSLITRNKRNGRQCGSVKTPSLLAVFHVSFMIYIVCQSGCSKNIKPAFEKNNFIQQVNYFQL